MSTLQWFEAVMPVNLEVRQVYGFIFSTDGRILVLEDEGVFNLPGGKPENSESMVETLTREALEEVQATIGAWEYLGYQLVEGIETFAQVRLVAVIDRFLRTNADPSTGRKYLRVWVPPADLNELLRWGESGERQIASAIARASRFGILWDGTPRAYVEAK